MFLLSAPSRGLSGSGATDRYWVTDINRTELKAVPRTPPALGFVAVNRSRDELDAVKTSAMTELGKFYGTICLNCEFARNILDYRTIVVVMWETRTTVFMR